MPQFDIGNSTDIEKNSTKDWVIKVFEDLKKKHPNSKGFSRGEIKDLLADLNSSSVDRSITTLVKEGFLSVSGKGRKKLFKIKCDEKQESTKPTPTKSKKKKPAKDKKRPMRLEDLDDVEMEILFMQERRMELRSAVYILDMRDNLKGQLFELEAEIAERLKG